MCRVWHLAKNLLKFVLISPPMFSIFLTMSSLELCKWTLVTRLRRDAVAEVAVSYNNAKYFWERCKKSPISKFWNCLSIWCFLWNLWDLQTWKKKICGKSSWKEILTVGLEKLHMKLISLVCLCLWPFSTGWLAAFLLPLRFLNKQQTFI